MMPFLFSSKANDEGRDTLKSHRNSRHYRRKKKDREMTPRKDIQPKYTDRLKDYDAVSVQQMWEDSIELDLKFPDPWTSHTNKEYIDRLSHGSKVISMERRKKSSSKYHFNRLAFQRAPYHEQKMLDQTFRFESRMTKVTHSVCSNCHECSLGLTVTTRKSLCDTCVRKKTKDSYGLSNVALPVWYDDKGTVMYNIPDELKCLTIAEILLIQRVAPLVPIVHIRNGTLGLKGHVCSFLQDISSVATVLPQLPQNVKAVKMVRTYTGADGSHQTKMYMVNRKRVLNALDWLVKYHRDYRQAHNSGELCLQPSNLDWIGNANEAELPTASTMTRTYDTPTAVDGERNLGVSTEQTFNPEHIDNNEFDSSGIACSSAAGLTNEAEESAICSLKEAAANQPEVSVLDWPQTSTEAISEYTSDMRIFVNAFPHLFPGGIGDYQEMERKTELSADNWARHLLLYKDGRFARDPIFPFFAYNFCVRRRNVKDGSYFVKGHISDPPKTLDELKAQLRDGNNSFVNKISFFSRRIRGSDAYWRHKRSELYNWIHHHIAAEHGAPSVFMTLSCAEYFWPDAIRLLEERVWIANGKNTNEHGVWLYEDGTAIDFHKNRSALNKAVNDYSIVIQEFFIMRVEDYLNTVGKELFGIEHYWCRFEFAKGRGQIHAHLVAILNKELMNELQRQLHRKDMNIDEEAAVIGEWAEDTFGLTACMPLASRDAR